MAASTMQFGPEWMRKAKPSARPQAAASPPPPSGGIGSHQSNAHAPPGASSYSSLVTPPASSGQTKRDIAHPFKYSRDEMLQVWKDGGGSSTLPIEVERWEGIVREVAGDPICLREFSETEKKLYATSINSEIRRRQSTDYIAQGDRSKGGTLNNSMGLMGRRRRGDSSGADQPPLSISRKTSWSGGGNLTSPSLASPRTRLGGGSFDGVLNGGDNTWGNGKRRVPSGHPLTERLEEEAETKKDAEPSESQKEESLNRKPIESDLIPSQATGTSNNESTGGIDDIKSSMKNLALNVNNDSQSAELSGGDTSKAKDLGKIQWSYIDPSGNVQGPFPGETMQQWHEAHYFTDDLMMRRTTIDSDFMPLIEIKRRAQGERIFVSPLSDVLAPPGLSRLPSGPGLNPILQRSSVMDSPRQPSPQAFGRNILDSWNGGSATGSASPSSSYGGNFSHGPVLPDPVAVGSRLASQRFVSDVPLSGRISAGSYSSNDTSNLPHTMRHGFNDPIQQSRVGFNSRPNIPWQTSANNDIQGWNGLSEPTHPQIIHDGFGGVNANQAPFIQDIPYVTPAVQNISDPYMPPNNFYDQSNHLDYNRSLMVQPDLNIRSEGFSHIHSENIDQFNGHPQHLPAQQASTGFTHEYDQTSSPVPVSPSVRVLQQQQTQPPQPTQQLPVSPWGIPPIKRPRPFEAEHPTKNNTFPVPSSVPPHSVWGPSPTEAPVTPVPAQDSWLTSQQPANEGWGQLTEEPQSLTTANVTQHNESQNTQKQRKHGEPAEGTTTTQATARTTEASATSSKSPVSGPTPAEAATQPTPSKRKGGASSHLQTPEKAHTLSSIPAKATPTPAAQKTAWAKDDDSKPKAAVPMNLREIQEAEKKKQDARKAAEKERERVARAAASNNTSTEEVQFTASWGLPTSQAGARVPPGSISVMKENHTTNPAPSSAPVWTNAAKPAAKTMKEIQEEEEKRKQAAKERETVAAAAKRATSVPVPKPSVVSGSAWTVVGSSGKTSTPVVPGSRPAVVPQASNPPVPTASRAAPAPAQRPVASPQVTKANSTSSKGNEDPSTPSAEFLKWMRESLRDLNSSVQFEEIAQVLLSFPLDPDPSTVELIAETVYGASTTVDGRRFASEFISRRKSDSATRSGTQSQSGHGVLSLADVVKAQPKSTQNEFGGYKVVKKKNKRG